MSKQWTGNATCSCPIRRGICIGIWNRFQNRGVGMSRRARGVRRSHWLLSTLNLLLHADAIEIRNAVRGRHVRETRRPVLPGEAALDGRERRLGGQV